MIRDMEPLTLGHTAAKLPQHWAQNDCTYSHFPNWPRKKLKTHKNESVWFIHFEEMPNQKTSVHKFLEIEKNRWDLAAMHCGTQPVVLVLFSKE